jgi:hypothetical protein
VRAVWVTAAELKVCVGGSPVPPDDWVVPTPEAISGLASWAAEEAMAKDKGVFARPENSTDWPTWTVAPSPGLIAASSVAFSAAPLKKHPVTGGVGTSNAAARVAVAPPR